MRLLGTDVSGHHHDHRRVRRPPPGDRRRTPRGLWLMIGGIALLGTVTATVASWLVETVAAEK
jgi:hypothetical protein